MLVKEASSLVKAAVTVCGPTASEEAVEEAAPFERVTGARWVPSIENVTVPVGVPSVEEMFAVSVTFWPKEGADGEKASSVTVTGNGELSPVCTISRVGGVASAAFAALPLKVTVFEKAVADVGVN